MLVLFAQCWDNNLSIQDEVGKINVGLYVQTQVYFIVPTKPLDHWPFWLQTSEWPEVSPEVILNGLAKESSFLPDSVASWVLMTLLNQLNLSARDISLFLANSAMGLTLIMSQLLGRCANLPFCPTLNLQYLTPRLLRQCDISFLRCDVSYNNT